METEWHITPPHPRYKLVMQGVNLILSSEPELALNAAVKKNLKVDFRKRWIGCVNKVINLLEKKSFKKNSTENLVLQMIAI